MKLYILYQTDPYQSLKTRCCFGVYSTKELAEEAAIALDLDNDYSMVQIEEVDLDAREEI